ncbi:nucleotidyltransferase family protein [Ilumatobacter sp.]|uniref:nucleotidyltransferase family protein n=1 Tax=Ilumatobacter sp. TaxID=1967498 RepID=UPI003AF66C11
MTPTDSLRHLVSWGLAGGPTEPVELGSADGLASLAEFHQVTGVVLAALDQGAASDVRASLVDDLAARHVGVLHRSLAAEADLVTVARRLEARGIEFRVLKGCATAHLDYVDPAMRATSDVDLLVRSERLAPATDAVEGLVDRTRTVPDRRRSWTERYGKDRTLALHTGGELDLHRMLVPGFHGLVDDHDWFASPESFTLAGAELAALATPDRLVHAIAHAGFADHVRYHSIRDVPVLLAAVGDEWRTAVEDHPHWQGLIARGIEVVWSQFDLQPHRIREWAAGVQPDWRERAALRTFDLPGSRQHWGGVAAVAPWRWPGLLVPISVPSRSYLAFYDRTPWSHVRATVTKVGRGRGVRRDRRAP